MRANSGRIFLIFKCFHQKIVDQIHKNFFMISGMDIYKVCIDLCKSIFQFHTITKKTDGDHNSKLFRMIE